MTSIDMHCAIAERPGSPPPAKSAISIRALGAMARGSAGGSAGAQRARPTNRGRRGGTAREPPREGKKKKTKQANPSLNFQPEARVCGACAFLRAPAPRRSPRKFGGRCGAAPRPNAAEGPAALAALGRAPRWFRGRGAGPRLGGAAAPTSARRRGRYATRRGPERAERARPRCPRPRGSAAPAPAQPGRDGGGTPSNRGGF